MSINSVDRQAGYQLLESGTLVNFDIVDTKVEPSPGGDETVVKIDLHLGEVEEEGDRTDDHEWGGFGFIFCLALLSFQDARPRGGSDEEFEEEDEFNVADLIQHLQYERGELHFHADYIRGRCLKTDITIRPDGKAKLMTWCRGEVATRWVQRMKGKKVMEVVK